LVLSSLGSQRLVLQGPEDQEPRANSQERRLSLS